MILARRIFEEPKKYVVYRKHKNYKTVLLVALLDFFKKYV